MLFNITSKFHLFSLKKINWLQKEFVLTPDRWNTTLPSWLSKVPASQQTGNSVWEQWSVKLRADQPSAVSQAFGSLEQALQIDSAHYVSRAVKGDPGLQYPLCMVQCTHPISTDGTPHPHPTPTPHTPHPHIPFCIIEGLACQQLTLCIM